MNQDDNSKGDSYFYERLRSIQDQISSERLNQTLNNLKQRNEYAHIRIKAYQDSLRNFLGQFRAEVLRDFKFNREHDRKVKKWLIYIMLAFYVLLFLGVLFTILAFLCGWGITENLSELFKVSLLGVILSGAISLSIIVFKYIFNKTDDVFYKYSVDLYKHIVEERCSPPENEKEIDD